MSGRNLKRKNQSIQSRQHETSTKVLVERRRKVMNRHGDKNNMKKNHLKYGCKQNMFQALRHKETLCPAESMPGFPKGNAGTKHCTSCALESHSSSPLPCQLQCSCMGRWRWHSWPLFRLCTEQSHLTAADSPISCHSLFFSLWLKLVLPHFWCMQIKLLLLSRKHAEETYNSIVAFVGLNDKVF